MKDKSASSSASGHVDSEQGAMMRGKRKLTRTPTDQIVKKAVRDNFKGPEWTPHRLYTHKVNNMTLVELLTERIRAWRREDPDVTRGAGLYKEVKDIYRDDESMKTRLLNSLSDDLALTESLVDALKPTKGAVSNVKVQSWIQASSTASGDDLVLLMQWALDLNPVNDKHRRMLLDLVRFFKKINIETHHGHFFEFVKPWISDVLIHAFSKVKLSKNREWPMTFLKTHSSLVAMVLPVGSLQAVMASAIAGWHTHRLELKELVAFDLGEAIFGFSMRTVAQRDMDTWLREKVEQIESAKGPLSGATFDATVTTLQKELAQTSFGKFLESERDIEFKYRGLAFPAHIADTNQYILLAVAACYKGLAVEGGNAPSMWIEHVLPFREALANPPTVDLEWCEPCKQARQALKDCVQEYASLDAGVLKEVVNLRTSRFLEMDPFFKVELAVVRAIAESSDGKQLLLTVLNLMPSENERVTPLQALSSIERVEKGDLYKLSKTTAQGKLAVIKALLTDLAETQPLTTLAAIQADLSLQDIANRFKFFLTHEDETADSPMTFGAEAWRKRYKDMCDTASGASIKPEKIEELEAYSWLVDDAARKDLASLSSLVQKAAAAKSKVVRGTKKQKSESSSSSGRAAVFAMLQRPKAKAATKPMNSKA